MSFEKAVEARPIDSRYESLYLLMRIMIMSKVYQKLGLFGKTYWHDDGLFVKKITKQKYDEIVIKAQIAEEIERQKKEQKR